MQNIDVIDREESSLPKQWLTITYLQLICFWVEVVGLETGKENKNVSDKAASLKFPFFSCKRSKLVGLANTFFYTPPSRSAL